MELKRMAKLMYQDIFVFDTLIEGLVPCACHCRLSDVGFGSEVEDIRCLEVIRFPSITAVSNSHFSVVEERNTCLPGDIDIIFTGANWTMHPHNFTRYDANTNLIFQAVAFELVRHKLF